MHIFDWTSANALNLIANRAAAYTPIDMQDLLQGRPIDPLTHALAANIVPTGRTDYALL
jgi:hypothetical protein